MAETVYVDDRAERTVIATVLADRSAWGIAGGLEPDDFGEPHHRALWEACREVVAAGLPVTPETVHDQLRRASTLHVVQSTVGGVRSFEFDAVTVDRLDAAVALLRDLSMARRLTREMERLLARARSGLAPSALRDVVLERVTEAARSTQTSATVTLAEAVQEHWEEMDRRDPTDRVSIGVRSVDEALCGGMLPGQLIVLGARTSTGKSAISLQSAVCTAARGPVLFVSLEMPRAEVAARVVALHGEGLSVAQMRGANRLSREAMDTAVAASAVASNLPVFIDDSPKMTLDSLVSCVLRQHARTPLRLVIVDHMHFIEPRPGRDADEAHWSDVTKTLKRLAKQVGAPVLALAQFNRGAEDSKTGDGRPRLKHLKGSGAIEQDADVVVFLYRESLYRRDADPRAAEAIIAKQRNGPLGVVPLEYDGDSMSFREAVGEHRVHVPAHIRGAHRAHRESHFMDVDGLDDGHDMR